jgi:hypothetical protein
MVNSGATSCFIDFDFALSQNFPLRKKTHPKALLIVNRRKSSAGDILYKVNIRLQINQYLKTLIFQVTKISGYSAIFKHSWLSHYNCHSPGSLRSVRGGPGYGMPNPEGWGLIT